jgi:hypothetical protein
MSPPEKKKETRQKNDAPPIISADESRNEVSVAPSQASKASRGRRPIEDTKYISESRAKIRGWKIELKRRGLSKDAKKSLTNKISALESRISKRQETNALKSTVTERRARFEQLATLIVDSSSTMHCGGILIEACREGLPVNCALSLPPVQVTSKSAPIGGKQYVYAPTTIQRTSSREKKNESQGHVLLELLMALYESSATD